MRAASKALSFELASPPPIALPSARRARLPRRCDCTVLAASRARRNCLVRSLAMNIAWINMLDFHSRMPTWRATCALSRMARRCSLGTARRLGAPAAIARSTSPRSAAAGAAAARPLPPLELDPLLLPPAPPNPPPLLA